VARLCAATGVRLHLIGRLGFRLDNRSLKRAGLDYWESVDLARHITFEEFERAIKGRIWCVETPGDQPYTRADFADEDCLLFGSESSGLPLGIREKYAGTLVGIPMPTGKVRSLNLATSVGVVLYEALRQLYDW
jgi:tRNA (cytidine/uridine-2'-O-)-methyltransferase